MTSILIFSWIIKLSSDVYKNTKFHSKPKNSVDGWMTDMGFIRSTSVTGALENVHTISSQLSMFE